MHDLEPYFNWRDYYTAENDEYSPFYGREYSEFEFTHQIYNFAIHPQWDTIGSPTLFVKVLYADYERGFSIIELIGEWNDCLHNDIMFLKRELADFMIHSGINKFMLIGENILNFHSSDDSYYEEWFDEIYDGWICFVNFRQHVMNEFIAAGIDYYVVSGGELSDLNWRTYKPAHLFDHLDKIMRKRIDC